MSAVPTRERTAPPAATRVVEVEFARATEPRNLMTSRLPLREAACSTTTRGNLPNLKPLPANPQQRASPASAASLDASDPHEPHISDR